ncbi:MAG: rod shape-determining protein RodA [Deltaproteobacteria bacterium]|nr:rod shape-determining protein RodA [Deltaproteobacteria bacterium]
MKIDRRLFVNFDWILLVLVLVISCIGLLNLYSISCTLTHISGKPLYIKQFYWMLIGLAMMLAAASIDYHFIVRYGYVIYCISLLLLVSVFIQGTATHGSQRWLFFWGLSFQPSELMKLTAIIALTKYITENKINEGYHIKSLAIPLAIAGVPCLIIAIQPDLGTALFLAILFFSVILFVGVNRKTLVMFATSGIVLAPLCWFFLKDYQRERILTFLNPERDPLGSGYHIIQSIIAVGSGGIFGKGFLKGTQSQLKFLPEQQTDFVFSVFAEEWGFLGAIILMFMFLALILWGLKIARNSKDLAGTLIAFGITVFIFWGVFINVGMILGTLPVVGIPLPFLSYGGSSMVVLMTGVGLLMNVSMRRFMLQP